MKIYYIGNICSDKEYNKIISSSKRKPSVAGLVFENLLLRGFKELGIDIDVRTFMNIALYPNSKKILIPYKKEKLKCGYITKWMPSINLPFLKQLIYKIMAYIDFKIWLHQNKNNKNKAIITYSIYDFMANAALKIGMKNNIPICAIIPDLPGNHFEIVKASGIKNILSERFIRKSIEIQDKFDAYVLFTEQMNEVVNKNNKPHIVVEGICNSDIVSKYNDIKKYEKKAVMYAGMLEEIHRVGMIAEAFMKVNGDYELWFFGSGNYENELKKLADKDSRIKIFGRVPHEVVLEYEKKASLLINVRNSKEQYTKYSFPSKTIEYMSSGTPLLTTKLPGIPKEYFNYVYLLEDETISGLTEKLNTLLIDDKLYLKGEDAQRFVLENKNSRAQARRIYSLIEEV